MAGKTYANQINPMEVNLAIEQLLIAPEGTAWTIGRVDPASPPTGFVNLGAVVEDTPQLSISREKFELDTGIPRVRQFEVTTGMNGSFSCQLHSYSWRKLQYALGNYSAVSSATAVTSIASVTNRNVVTLTTTSTSINVGRQIVFAAPGNQDSADETKAIETQIASIHSDGLTLFLQPTPATTPTTAMNLYYYDVVSQAVGTSKNTYYALLGVADLLDGSQIVHEFRKAAPAAEIQLAITPEQNVRIPLTFNALGYSKTAAIYGGSAELIVMESHYFPRLS